jgi:high affinity Mn2+ porin
MPLKIGRRLVLAFLAFAACVPVTCAQDAPTAPAPASAGLPASTADTPETTNESAVTLFPHSETSRWWISGQANFILQWHPAFHSPYSGPNSFRALGENDTSKVYTLYTGFALTHTTEIFVDAESAGGHGLSEALGLAGFTNLDVVRNPALGPTPYLARLELRQIVPLSSERVDAEQIGRAHV